MKSMAVCIRRYNNLGGLIEEKYMSLTLMDLKTQMENEYWDSPKNTVRVTFDVALPVPHPTMSYRD